MTLFDEANFCARADALDALELQPDRFELREQLEAVDERLFTRLRGEIRDGLRGEELLRRIREYVPPQPTRGERYDHLDAFMAGLLLTRELPEETKPRAPEMVFYQRTPSRIVLELVERAALTPHDVFYDIGSGLGEVAAVVNLLTGASAKGVEVEPAYCDYANALAADLGLSRVEFLCADAREVDFSDATVCFLYTPFVGWMLASVVTRLRARIFTYGPCSEQVAMLTDGRSVALDENDAATRRSRSSPRE